MEQYKEKLEEAKKLYESANDDQKHVLESLFPELKESEDEQIRKVLVGWFKRYKEQDTCGSEMFNGIPTDNILTWLEKQVEQKSAWSEEDEKRIFRIKLSLQKDMMAHKHSGCDIADLQNCEDWLMNLYESHRVQPQPKQEWSERDKEEKVDDANKVEPKDYNSIDPHFSKTTDKIEPKFDIDDWIVHQGTGNVYKIVAIINNKYQLKYGDNYTVQKCIDVDRCSRLWDINKDTKTGDVLVYKGNIKYTTGTKYERIYLFNNLNKAFFTLTKTSYGVKGYNMNVNVDYPDNTVPATKEQKEILFKTMANVGYTFDFKKKELKKIEQVHAKWSEEAPAKAEFADYE